MTLFLGLVDKNVDLIVAEHTMATDVFLLVDKVDVSMGGQRCSRVMRIGRQFQ